MEERPVSLEEKLWRAKVPPRQPDLGKETGDSTFTTGGSSPLNKYFTAENGRLGEKMEGRVQPVTQGDVTGPCLAGLEAT